MAGNGSGIAERRRVHGCPGLYHAYAGRPGVYRPNLLDSAGIVSCFGLLRYCGPGYPISGSQYARHQVLAAGVLT